jgi:hypothetical protein
MFWWYKTTNISLHVSEVHKKGNDTAVATHSTVKISLFTVKFIVTAVKRPFVTYYSNVTPRDGCLIQPKYVAFWSEMSSFLNHYNAVLCID